MLYEYVKHGVFAGVIAGLVYGVFVAIVANPLAHYMEGLAHHSHEHGHEPASAVTEMTTTVVSTGSGVLWGILLGGLFGLAFYFLEPALPGTGRIKVVILGGMSFLTVSAVPWLAMPPAAPGAEHALPINTRLLLYGGLMLVGAATAGTSLLLYQRTVSHGHLKAITVAGIPLLAVVIVIPLATPTFITTTGIPMELVMAFQGLVVFGQLALWTIIVAGFNWFWVQPETSTESARLDDELTAST